jgi:CheY-like chemotaxis protein
LLRKKRLLNRNCREALVRRHVKSRDMKTPVILLLTDDARLEDCVAQAVLQIGGLSHLADNAGDALQMVRGIGRDLDLAVVDLEQDPYAMALLGAIQMCRADFPVIVVTHTNAKLVEALAYANGAVACLHKPINATELAAAIIQCLPAIRYPLETT